MSEETYAVIGPDGKVLSLSNVIPTELEDGQRISYRSAYIYGSDQLEPLLRLELNGCSGIARRVPGPFYMLEVVGDDLENLAKVIRKLQLALGSKEIGLRIPLLPALGSAWRRIRFLVWDYSIRGRITAQ